MIRLAAVALLIGVTAAHADSYYVDLCHDDREDWTLALNQSDGAAAFFKDFGRVRVGTYEASGDDAFVHVEDMKLHLHVASGDASWSAGDAKGLLACRFASYEKPERWGDAGSPAAPPFIAPPDDEPFILPGTGEQVRP
jgi:hypothetical protein